MDKRNSNVSPHPEVKKTSHSNDSANPSPHRARDLNLIGYGQNPNDWLKPQARTSEISSALPSTLDAGRSPASEEMNEVPIVKHHEPPEKLELASECTPQHPILPGGMQAWWRQVTGEPSQGRDNRVLLKKPTKQVITKRQNDCTNMSLTRPCGNQGQITASTAIAMTDLADVYAKQYKFKPATDWYQRALPIYERELAQHHPKLHEVRAKLRLGQKLGSYDLISFLGGGGFGYVYLGKCDQPSTPGQDHQLPTASRGQSATDASSRNNVIAMNFIARPVFSLASNMSTSCASMSLVQRAILPT